jgi:hypothetical protein
MIRSWIKQQGWALLQRSGIDRAGVSGLPLQWSGHGGGMGCVPELLSKVARTQWIAVGDLAIAIHLVSWVVYIPLCRSWCMARYRDVVPRRADVEDRSSQ